MDETRESLEFDDLFVAGGPANLAGAIHLLNMAQKAGKEIDKEQRNPILHDFVTTQLSRLTAMDVRQAKTKDIKRLDGIFQQALISIWGPGINSLEHLP